MTRRPVASSNLRAVGYDAATQILEIQFHHGGVYQYSNVPESVYRGLMSAASKGTYFYAHIRDTYLHKKVG